MTTKTTKTVSAATKTGDWLVAFYRREARNFRAAAKGERTWAAEAMAAGMPGVADGAIQRARNLERMAAESDAKGCRRMARLTGRA